MKFKIRVVRKHHPKAVYCGRPSPLGNPFPMRTEADRDRVCDEYQKWFTDNLEVLKPELRKFWIKGAKDGELFLGCFCAPKRCHCDTIKAFLESYMD